MPMSATALMVKANALSVCIKVDGHHQGETDAAFVAHVGMFFAFFVIFACDGCIWWVPCRCTAA